MIGTISASEANGCFPARTLWITSCQRQSKSEPKGSSKCCHFGFGMIAA